MAFRERKGGLDARFWSKVDRRGPDECWNWTAGRCASGYGSFGIARGTGMPAHRWALIQSGEYVPDGMHVMHSCDNRLCVNPAHLSVGTLADNMADKIAKGRQARGEKLWTAKLTEADVRALRRRRLAGRDLRAWAARHGVTTSTAQHAAAGRTWRHVEMMGV